MGIVNKIVTQEFMDTNMISVGIDNITYSDECNEKLFDYLREYVDDMYIEAEKTSLTYKEAWESAYQELSNSLAKYIGAKYRWEIMENENMVSIITKVVADVTSTINNDYDLEKIDVELQFFGFPIDMERCKKK